MQEPMTCSDDPPDSLECERKKPWTHLLRHHLTSDVEERARSLLAPGGNNGDQDAEECAAAIWQLKQPQLREVFARVYNTSTTSCNNGWMRSKLLQAMGLDPRWTPKQAQGQEQGQEPDGAAPVERPADAADPGSGVLRPKRQRAAVKRLGDEPDASGGSRGRGSAGRGGGRKKRQGRSSSGPPTLSLRSAGCPGTPFQDADTAVIVPPAAAAAVKPAQRGWETASLPLLPPAAPKNWQQCKRLLSDSAHSLPQPGQLSDAAHSLPLLHQLPNAAHSLPLPRQLPNAAHSLPLPRQLPNAAHSLPLPRQLSDAPRSLPLPSQAVGPALSALPQLAALQGLPNVQYVHVVLPLAAARHLVAGSAQKDNMPPAAPQTNVPLPAPVAAPPAGLPSPQECLERYWQEQQQQLEQRRGQYERGCGGLLGGQPLPPALPGALSAQLPSSLPPAGGDSWQACHPSPLLAPRSLPLLPQPRAELSLPPMLRAEQSLPPPQLGLRRSPPLPPPGQLGTSSLQLDGQRRLSSGGWMHPQRLEPMAGLPPMQQGRQGQPLQPLQLRPGSMHTGMAHCQLQEFGCSLSMTGGESLTPATPLPCLSPPDQQQRGYAPMQLAQSPARQLCETERALQAPSLLQLLQSEPHLCAQPLPQEPPFVRGLLPQQHCGARPCEQQVPAWQQQQAQQAQLAQQAQHALLDIDPGFAADLEELCSACSPGGPAWLHGLPVAGA